MTYFAGIPFLLFLAIAVAIVLAYFNVKKYDKYIKPNSHTHTHIYMISMLLPVFFTYLCIYFLIQDTSLKEEAQ
jgi:cytochrome c biogenesis factor